MPILFQTAPEGAEEVCARGKHENGLPYSEQTRRTVAGNLGVRRSAGGVLPPLPGLIRFLFAFPRLAPWAIIFRPLGSL